MLAKLPTQEDLQKVSSSSDSKGSQRNREFSWQMNHVGEVTNIGAKAIIESSSLKYGPPAVTKHQGKIRQHQEVFKSSTSLFGHRDLIHLTAPFSSPPGVVSCLWRHTKPDSEN